jgi:hypothetical protein
LLHCSSSAAPKNHTPYNIKRLSYDVYLNKEAFNSGTRES